MLAFSICLESEEKAERTRGFWAACFSSWAVAAGHFGSSCWFVNLIFPDQISKKKKPNCFLLILKISQVPVSRHCPDHLISSTWMLFFAMCQSAAITLLVDDTDKILNLPSPLQLGSCLYAVSNCNCNTFNWTISPFKLNLKIWFFFFFFHLKQIAREHPLLCPFSFKLGASRAEGPFSPHCSTLFAL